MGCIERVLGAHRFEYYGQGSCRHGKSGDLVDLSQVFGGQQTFWWPRSYFEEGYLPLGTPRPASPTNAGGAA
jgi:hypothetical protein